MDFSKAGSPTTQKPSSSNPFEIFRNLPSLNNTPNDLWMGQAEALMHWNAIRDKNDVLISLNTGAGKTIAGLLIAQSLFNEGHKKVLYICSTIALVEQTSKEASRIGLEHTKRIRQDFDNTLFESGKTFCITTYQALFNGHSQLRKKHFPEAIIFDDAHVAESLLRDAFTIRIDSFEKKTLFNEISQLFEPHFKRVDNHEKFKDSLRKDQTSASFVFPGELQKKKTQLLQILTSKPHDLSKDKSLCYPFEHLKDKIKLCTAVFIQGVFELSPPFLPSLDLDIFRRPIKRVYLSATLQSQTEFIRAFGRKPEAVILPTNDAGNGERLIINGEAISEGISTDFASDLSKNNKVLIAVPNKHAAKKWAELATPPEDFSDDLATFKSSENGAFILVSRVDGIDLPHKTCNLMIIDGLPSGTSLLERCQREFLGMNNANASKIANRLTQLFGRINRGRNDYGVFLLQGRELNIWLNDDRNVSLLPPLLQKQVLLGRTVQEDLEIKKHEKVKEAINDVFNREKSWLDFYKKETELGELDQKQANKAKENEAVLEEITISETKYIYHLWNREYSEARSEIEASFEKAKPIDELLAGWQAVWLGAVCDLEGDTESAKKAYSIAEEILGPAIAFPKESTKNINNVNEDHKNNFYTSLNNYLDFSDEDNKRTKKVKSVFETLGWIKSESTNKAEESVRFLGEVLGFDAKRPNKLNKGPDVLWVDNENKIALAFELKTGKKIPTIYKKEEIGQGHNDITWVKRTYPEINLLGFIYIGPEKGTFGEQATPSDEMHRSSVAEVSLLIDDFLAVFRDLLDITPSERGAEILLKSQEERWKMQSIASRLKN